MKRRIVIAAIASALTLALAGCGDKAAEKEIKLGTLSGPHAEVAEVAAKVAKEKGLNVRIVEFSDYGHVNEALAVKDIDVNAFQHVPFLEKAHFAARVRVHPARENRGVPARRLFAEDQGQVSDYGRDARVRARRPRQSRPGASAS